MYNPDEICDRLVMNIKYLCKLKGLSYYSLAKRSNISTSTMHSIVNGKTRPQIYTLLQICNVLEVTVNELFGDNIFFELCAEERRLLMCFRCLSEQKKELLRIYIEMLQNYNDKTE